MRARIPHALLAITALAAVARFATLDLQSYWYDEAFTVQFAAMSFRDMLEGIQRFEATPPLHYVLSWLWEKPFGSGEVGQRSLAAVIGTATVPAVYGAARELVSPRAGLAAALLAAVSPMLVWYSQETRSYVLLVLLSTLALWAFARARRDASPYALAAWALATALALATHYLAAFLAILEAFLLINAFPVRRTVLAVGGVALTAAGLLPLAAYQHEQGHSLWIAGRDLDQRLSEIPGMLLVTGRPDTLPPVLWVVGLGLAALGAWLLFSRADGDERRGGLLAGGLGLAALAWPMLLAVGGTDLLTPRNVIPAWTPLALAVAAGFAAPRAGWLGPAALAAYCALCVGILVAIGVEDHYHRADWRSVAEQLPEVEGGRAIAVSFLGERPLQIYRPRIRRMPQEGARVQELVYASAAEGARQTRPDPVMRRLGPFRLVSEKAGEGWVVLRYRAPEPRFVGRVEPELIARGAAPVTELHEPGPEAADRGR